MDDRDWQILLSRIESGGCTPFLGAGACYGALPLGGQIAREWSEREGYPLPDKHDLPRVAQFLAVKYDPPYAKGQLLDGWFRNPQPPDFRDPEEPHGLLAELPLPVYMTTNYDPFMTLALQQRHRDPKREVCRWNEYLQRFPLPSIFDRDPDYQPTVANPIVFHLHGYDESPESLVLTEDDYLSFLTALARREDLLPAPVRRALDASSLLFIGYSLADWNFRVLFQGLSAGLRRRSVAVMLPPGDSEPERQAAQKYLTDYYQDMDVRVYWGTAREFAAELRERREGK